MRLSKCGLIGVAVSACAASPAVAGMFENVLDGLRVSGFTLGVDENPLSGSTAAAVGTTFQGNTIDLGAFEVTLLEIARAYAVLASGGVVPALRSYVEVVSEGGRVLDRKPLDFVRAFEPDETFLVTSLLRGVVDRGTGRALRRLGYRGELAGKTGTTSGFRDAWFIGFTPDLLVGVWVGFDDGKGLGIPGSVAALPIFADFLMQYRGPAGRSSFVPPPALERVAIHRASGLRAARDCPGAPEYFLRGTAPTRSCGAAGTQTVLDRMLDWFKERL